MSEPEVEEDLPEGLWLEVGENAKGEPIQRWFEDEAEATAALVAVGTPPGRIRELLAPPPAQWVVIAAGDVPLVYQCADMQTAIKLILSFCEEENLDGLEAMRHLEQAAADGLESVTYGPFTATMAGES